jgi:hypothetical protein
MNEARCDRRGHELLGHVDAAQEREVASAPVADARRHRDDEALPGLGCCRSPVPRRQQDAQVFDGGGRRDEGDAPCGLQAPQLTLFSLTHTVCCIFRLVCKSKRVEGGSNPTAAAAASSGAAPRAAAAAADTLTLTLTQPLSFALLLLQVVGDNDKSCISPRVME